MLTEDIGAVRDAVLEYATRRMSMSPTQLEAIADILSDCAAQARAMEAQPVPQNLRGSDQYIWSDPRIRPVHKHLGIVQ